MKVSKLIKKLESLRTEHGDLMVGIYLNEFGSCDSLAKAEIRRANISATPPHPYNDDAIELGEKFIMLG